MHATHLHGILISGTGLTALKLHYRIIGNVRNVKSWILHYRDSVTDVGPFAKTGFQINLNLNGATQWRMKGLMFLIAKNHCLRVKNQTVQIWSVKFLTTRSRKKLNVHNHLHLEALPVAARKLKMQTREIKESSTIWDLWKLVLYVRHGKRMVVLFMGELAIFLHVMLVQKNWRRGTNLVHCAESQSKWLCWPILVKYIYNWSGLTLHNAHCWEYSSEQMLKSYPVSYSFKILLLYPIITVIIGKPSPVKVKKVIYKVLGNYNFQQF